VTIALLADIAVRWVRLKIQDSLATAASSAIQASVMRSCSRRRWPRRRDRRARLRFGCETSTDMTQLEPQLVTGVAVDVPFLLLVFACFG
jgi:hypothetical protein